VQREPRTSKELPREGEWRKKIHPFYVALMEYSKQMEVLRRSPLKEDHERAQGLARNPPEALREQARAAGDQLRDAGVVLHDFAGKILDLDLEDPSAIKKPLREPSDEQFMVSWLSWYKFGKTWRQLLQERNARSRQASKRILAVLTDYEKWKFGELDPNAMRFKIDRIHFELLAFGLDFGLGKLTPNELGDCFDALCTCGTKQDEPENRKKLRWRILKSLEKLGANTAALRIEQK